MHVNVGDSVDHVDTPWEAYPVIEKIDSEHFPEDPVAFFVGGGFWRTSRLKVAMTEDEFRIIERKMAINRGEAVPESEQKVADSVEWPEHLIEAECTRLLEQDGWRALRTDPVSDRGRGKGFGELGMADHLYIRYWAGYRPGAVEDIEGHADLSVEAQVLWIEFKSAKGEPSKKQIEWHTTERARGALTWIAGVDFPASVAGFVEHYRKSGLNRGRV